MQAAKRFAEMLGPKNSKIVVSTVPAHQSYVFLHSPFPPSVFPRKMRTTLSMALLSRISGVGGLVNWSFHGSHTTQDLPQTIELNDCTAEYSATAFSASGGRLELQKVSLQNLDHISSLIVSHTSGTLKRTESTGVEHMVDIYVCTHGARNCDCGTIGTQVFNTLTEELERRRAQDPTGISQRIRIGQTGHVSGHFESANMLIYPHGEWLGLLHPENVPSVLDRIEDMLSKPFDRQTTSPLALSHWRGRMGLTGQEQKSLYSQYTSTSL